MRKKFFGLIFSFILTVSAVCSIYITAYAESGTCGDNLTWTLDNEGTLTISGTGKMEDYSLRNGAPWKPLNYRTKKLVINNGITSIGDYAFWYETHLTSVVIPSGVTSIGNNAFTGCEDMESIEIPNSVTTIGRLTFSGCTSLTGIVIPDSVTTIGECAFQSCRSLTGIVIPDSVTNINGHMFEYCTSLTNCKLPKSITSIGTYAFNGCSNLINIEIPNCETVIDQGAFLKCSNLKKVVIYGGLTRIEYEAFSECYSLESVVIPDSVTFIGSYAFAKCYSLTGIVIPDSVTRIGAATFQWCKSLINIEIPNSVTSIGDSAFQGCESLINIEIPNNVKRIENNLFRDCSSLTDVAIPKTVTSIWSYAFDGCDSLKDIYYGGSQADWSNIGIFDDSEPLKNATIHFGEGHIPYISPVFRVVSIIDDEFYRYLANDYPNYLNNTAYNRYLSSCLSICNDVVQEYNGADDFWLSYAESFVNGTSIIIQNLFSEIGIGQSTQDEWLEKNAIEYVKLLQGSEYAISESWKGVEKKYKDFKFVIKSIDTANSAALEAEKVKFIKEVSSRTSCLSEAEATKIADRLLKKQPNGISNFFTKVDYAVDLADILLYSCQILDVEVSSLEILKNNIASDTPLYHAIEDRILTIKADPSGYVLEKYLTDEVTDKIVDFLDDFVDWSTGVFTGTDVSVTAKVVRTVSKLLYNYIYKGAKIDEIYGAIVAYDFYATTSASWNALLNQLLINKINGTPNSEELLTNFKFMFEARRIALANYVDACIEIEKHGNYTSLLNDIKGNASDAGMLCFDKYINSCMELLRSDISKGTVSCNHDISHISKTILPSCTKSGYSEMVCDICGYIYQTDVTAALEHCYITNIFEPKCMSRGYTSYSCTRCGSSYIGDIVPALGHTYCDWIEDNESNNHYRECSVCGYKETISHTWVEAEVITERDCTRDGLVRYICTDCGATQEIAISASNHLINHISAKSPTCTENGNIEYWYCSLCNNCFSDANAENKITFESTVIMALTHDWNELWSGDVNEHWHTCNHCGEVNDLDAHIFGEWAMLIGNANVETRICSVCGYTDHRVCENITSEIKDNELIVDLSDVNDYDSISLQTNAISSLITDMQSGNTEGITFILSETKNIHYNASSLGSIAAQLLEAESDAVRLVIKKVNNETVEVDNNNGEGRLLTEEQVATIVENSGEGKSFYRIALELFNSEGEIIEELSDFSGGTATVTVDYSAPENALSVNVVRIETDGKTTPLAAEYDDVNKTVTWTTDSHSYYMITAETEYLDVLGNYADKMTVKLKSEEGSKILTVSSCDGGALPEMTVYMAVYTSDSMLKSITVDRCVIGNDATVSVPVFEPNLENGETYKIMLWDSSASPIIKAIKNN
ncbi:MAG: leucine-rich repeat domain-containing protein [Ruminococcaceae bacterium]|nr:leucine-rich repeat domain-containing protein [Oscillospiraceae bacterium]